MQAFQIEIGAEYGLRDDPLRTEPLQRVKVLEHVRRKNGRFGGLVRIVALLITYDPHNSSSLGKIVRRFSVMKSAGLD